MLPLVLGHGAEHLAEEPTGRVVWVNLKPRGPQGRPSPQLASLEGARGLGAVTASLSSCRAGAGMASAHTMAGSGRPTWAKTVPSAGPWSSSSATTTATA